MKYTTIFIAIVAISMPSTHNAMLTRYVKQLKIINPFFSNVTTIATIRKVMDQIENEKLGYDDYSKRTGLIWSDISVKTSKPAEIIQEYNTTKVTQVAGALKQQAPQSILNYPAIKSIVCSEILPKTFEVISAWTKIPETVFAQIFLQRCDMSEAMDWHQDPGEDYNPQADYSLVLMLSEQNDPEYGWIGGEFKIRSGLPKDTFDTAHIETIIPRYNQGIIFNNQINSHYTTEVITAMKRAKRDIIVIPINLTQLPIKKDLQLTR